MLPACETSVIAFLGRKRLIALEDGFRESLDFVTDLPGRFGLFRWFFCTTERICRFKRFVPQVTCCEQQTWGHASANYRALCQGMRSLRGLRRNNAFRRSRIKC